MKNVHVLLAGESYLSLNCSYRDLAIGTEVRKPYWTYTKDWKHYMSVTDASVRPHNIYITSDEEIKEGDWYLTNKNTLCKCIRTDNKYVYSLEGGSSTNCKKIILTTDRDLIKDGVQEIPDEFLEWWIKNPSCDYIEIESQCLVEEKCACNSVKSVCKKPYYTFNYEVIIPQEKSKKIFDLPIATNLGSALTETMKSVSQHEGGIKQGEINLPNFKEEVCTCTDECLGYLTKSCKRIEEPKQETIEEFAENYLNKFYSNYVFKDLLKTLLIDGAKWQAERSYSEEEVVNILIKAYINIQERKISNQVVLASWFEQFKKK